MGQEGPMKSTDKVIKSFSILQEHADIISQIAKENGDSSESAALRYIINEYVRLVREGGDKANLPQQAAA